MNSHRSAHRQGAGPDVPLLRWVFQRGDATITSQVDRLGARAGYAISLVPHSDLSATVINTRMTPVAALQRHAVLAAALRQAGWAVATRG